MPRWPGFVGPSYRSQSAVADAERLVNWYVAKLQSQAAKAPYVLYPTPGVEEFLTLPQAPLRDLFGQQGRAWAVAGDRIHEVFGDMTAIDRGVVRFDGNPATSITNGDGGGQMLFTSGNHAYLLDMTTNALTDVVTGALMCGMLDTFFLVLDAGTSTLKISESNDGLTWLGTQIFQRSSASDPWRAMKVVNKRIYMFGEFTSDVFFNAGTSPFPFAPYGGSLIPHGIAAAFSAAEFQGGVAFLAQNRNGDRTVRLATGYSSADEISNEAVNYQLSRYDRVDDAEGFSYEEQGEPHYVLSFPSANATWGYTEDGGWHERGTWNPAANRYDVWHPRCHAFAFGEHLVGDRTSGRIDRMSIDLGLDAGGVELRRMRRAPAINQEHQRLFISNLELYLDTGVADATGQGSNPQVMLRKSRNGGRTWGPEIWRRTGRQGEFGRRVRWNRLGSGRDIAVEVVVSDPWPRSLVDCFINQAA